MTKAVKEKILPITLLIFLMGFMLWEIFAPVKTYSESERRILAQPSLPTGEQLLSGKYMSDFEAAALDQFPMREGFRKIKACMEYYVLQKKNSNGYYTSDGHISKLEYPLQETQLQNAIKHMGQIYKMYLEPAHVEPYLVIVPDKNCFLAQAAGQLMLDYNELETTIAEELPYMHRIAIQELLEKDDYYCTDTHWKQEKLLDVAERIGNEMGTELDLSFNQEAVEKPFYGVYYGQAMLPAKPDQINYLVNEHTENSRVTLWDGKQQKEVPVYDLDKINGKDAYEMFLSGAVPIITIQNPKALTDKRLILFRDSFGSSIAPLLLSGYREIVLVDTRYIQSRLLEQYVDFENADVLFLYSTLLFNNSMALKN